MDGYSRSDALKYRDYLIAKGMVGSSVSRVMSSIRAVFNFASLILLAYMINSAIDNAVLFSGFMHLTAILYFSAFNVTRPLFIITLFWVFIIHKYKKRLK